MIMPETRPGGIPPLILLAPSSFKGTRSASAVAASLREGLNHGGFQGQINTMPIADGGEGTLECLVAQGAEVHHATVRGPMGDTVRAAWVRMGGKGYVEAAKAVGVARLGQLSPTTAARSSSYGVGQLIVSALDAGVDEVVVTLGGAVTSDGGAGLLQALGVRLTDGDGRLIPPDGNQSLHLVARVDLAAVDRRLHRTPLRFACDVQAPLLGQHGAARTFGPQKGADHQAVETLEHGLTRWVGTLVAVCANAASVSAEPGMGASGGMAFGARALFGSRVVSGAGLVFDILGVEAALANAHLAVIGEGCLDDQSLTGKASIRLACLAASAGVPVVAVVGSVDLPAATLRRHGVGRVWSLEQMAGSGERAVKDTDRLLRRAGHELAGSMHG
jgi:glycerate kinase